MKKSTAYIIMTLLIVALAGCGAASRLITAKSQSERTDVFIEATDTGATPQGYSDLTLKADIKTHLAGYYVGESSKSLHGKPGYPFVFNIDGHAVIWKVDGKKEELPKYDEQGKTSKDPEAGTGIKYALEKKLRLRPGQHKVFFGLPEEDYYREVIINVKEGETRILEFKPVYMYKKTTMRIQSFMSGVRHYDILANGNPVAQ